MTVVPPGLTQVPDHPPILEQHLPQWARATPRRRSPLRRAGFVVLVVVTVAVGASAFRDRVEAPGPPDGGAVTVSAEVAGAATPMGG